MAGDQCLARAAGPADGRIASKPEAAKAASFWAFDGGVAAGSTHQSCVELGLCGRPGGERNSVQFADLDGQTHAGMPGGAWRLVHPSVGGH